MIILREDLPRRVLIRYGTSWFPWSVRRLAERPANLMFVLGNLVRG
jgi:proline dehydrogenase